MHPSYGRLPCISVQSYGHFDHMVTFSSSKCSGMVDMWLEQIGWKWKSKIKLEASTIVMASYLLGFFPHPHHRYVGIIFLLFLNLHCTLIYSNYFIKHVGSYFFKLCQRFLEENANFSKWKSCKCSLEWCPSYESIWKIWCTKFFMIFKGPS